MYVPETGEVEVVLREGDRDLAAWRGVGPVLIEDGASPRIGIDDQLDGVVVFKDVPIAGFAFLQGDLIESLFGHILKRALQAHNLAVHKHRPAEGTGVPQFTGGRGPQQSLSRDE